MIDRTKAHVRLLDEGIDVWRPCRIFVVGQGVGILLSDEYSFEGMDERWECNPGDIVAIEERKDRLYVVPVPQP